MKSRDIVLIPGSFCTGDLWKYQVGPLERAGFIVHRPKIDHLNTIETMADFIVKKYKGVWGVCGLSMGGIIAQQIAITRPEFLKRLLLISTVARPMGEEFRKECDMVIPKLKQGKLKELAEWAAKGWTPEARHSNKMLMSEIVAMAVDAGVEANINTMMACAHYDDMRPNLKYINAKTLIVCGKEDKVTTPVEWHREIHERIKGSELVVMERTGHLIPLEEPTKTSNLMVEWFHRA